MSNEKFKVKYGLEVQTGEITSSASENITLDPASGTTVNDGHMIIGQVNSNAILTTNGTGNLQLKTGSTNTGTIEITQGDNGNITIDPHGTGKVVISGDLQVDGTTTTINSTTLDVDDINITVAKGAATAAAADGAGITVEGPTTAATITYASADDSWNLNKKTAAPELQVDNININGNTISSTDTNGNVIVSPNATGDIYLTTDTTVFGDYDANTTITTNGVYNQTPTPTGNLTINTNSGTSSGSIIITAGANGDITLTPNGTGNFAIVPSNGGNLTNARNYVYGGIRNATTDSIGDIWALNSTGPVAAVRGISLDNSVDTTKTAGLVLRQGNATGTASARLIFERSRGTVGSPGAIQAGDFLGLINCTGYTSTGWLNDNIAAVAPATMTFAASENWTSNTALGTTFSLSLAPTATTITSGANLTTVIAHNPQTATYRSDAFTFRQGKTGTTDLLTLATGSATMSADSFTFRKSAGTSMVTIGSDGTVTMRDPSGYANWDKAFYQPKTAASGDSLFALSQTTTGADFPQFSYFNYRSTDGVNFTPTQNGDVIGAFKFNGNAYTSTTPGVPAGPAGIITVVATENWTSTANGAAINFSGIKTGTITDVNYINISSASATFKSDSYTFQDSSGTDICGSFITYSRQYGDYYNSNTITPADTNEHAFTLPSYNSQNGISIASNSQITFSNTGKYNLQFSVQWENTDTGGSDHAAYIWLSKNGTAVANSAGKITCVKSNSGIAAWNYICDVTTAGDYFELMYKVDNTAVIFPAAIASSPIPAIPSIILTVVPVGA